jgi:trk system potassium uptake protein TrkA
MKRVLVFGLGIFGSQIAKQLYESGLEVIAIDKNKDLVQRTKDFCTKAIPADARDKDILDEIGIHKHDIAVISFGEDLSASTLLILHLKELEVENIIVKVPNEDHKEVLQKLGATDAIIPEREIAKKVAKGIISPNVLDYLPISEDYTIVELVPPPELVGRNLAELELRKKHNIQVIAIRDTLSGHLEMVPRATSVIKSSHVLVIIGREKDISQIE